MKTALLAQNEALEARELNPSVKRSLIPLSHSKTFPVDVDGAIYPICCVEVVPSDSYQISNEVLLRQLQPLKVPVMTRFTLNTAYFYCSNRLAWKGWKMFSDQAHQGRSDISYSFEIPKMNNNYVAFNDDGGHREYIQLLNKSGSNISGTNAGFYGSNINYKNSIHTYLGVSHNSVSKSTDTESNLTNFKDDMPVAFPFFDYQIICRDFYTNIDRLPDNPDLNNLFDFSNPFSDWAFSNLYPKDDDEIRLIDGIQMSSGYHAGDDLSNNYTGFVLDKMRYHDLRYDYFTSSKRAPMRGTAPTIETITAVSSIDASDAVYTAESGTVGVLGVDYSTNKIGDAAVNISKDAGTGAVNDIDFTHAGSIGVKAALEKLKVNLTTTKKISAADIMLLSQLTLWQTMNMLHKPYYDDFLKAHYDNVNVGDSLAERPMYIGGTSQTIDINEVLQTSQSTDSAKLGSQAAVAHSLQASGVGSFYANDYGFIIGVAYILPDLIYDPALPRWASRRTIEDYYFPEFANLSMQATLNKELFFSNDNDWNNTPLGYVGAYDDLRSIPNQCAGDLLNPDYSDLSPWILRHSMANDNKPAINQRFISAKGNVDMSAWTAPNEPKFMLQCANYIKASRPMPFIAVPQIS